MDSILDFQILTITRLFIQVNKISLGNYEKQVAFKVLYVHTSTITF